MNTTAQDTVTTTLHVPTPLRSYTDGEATVEVRGATVGAALQHLVARFPDLKAHLFNESGALRSFINVYVGDEDIRYLQRAETPLTANDELSIVPSIAGG